MFYNNIIEVTYLYSFDCLNGNVKRYYVYKKFLKMYIYFVIQSNSFIKQEVLCPTRRFAFCMSYY